ncbi:hypothetical protein [Streptomyces scabiei]|uniref:hypothetical protein n=1 Tax=Streptomyces scabiei TaxID=1930 RepID=UPI001B32E425|nr:MULTISPECIES: hypothetical protein [Streptomyces]MBP5895227.1 hypothetical protein [Streptomyces sp. LBUM 1481]MBP5925506.1 hypothetical protein [Streptomyces sp. LBUM 1483]MDX2684084.1 hypothetical protein [Streptomyces scabiei]MDX2748883.1 hypothetical protein [Streptomyces scabiei]MDX2803072.1 hypothetical protein [Streptomyces scabiei]
MSSGTTEKPYGWDEDLAQRIYGAAKKLAEQHGRAFTFDDVAQESGATVEEVSKYCNGSKPMLVIKAFEDTVEKMTGLLQSVPPLEDPDHMKLVNAIELFYTAHPVLGLAAMHFLIDDYFDGKQGVQETIVEVSELVDRMSFGLERP